MIASNQWYNIAKTVAAGSRTGIRIEMGSWYALLVIAVDYGSASITAAESNINPDELKLAARIRYNGGAWYADVRVSPGMDATLTAALYDNKGWSGVEVNTSTVGSTICIINDVISQIRPSVGGESLWTRVNVGTEEEPVWALMPKEYEGMQPGIVTASFITFGGMGTGTGNGSGTNTLDTLNDTYFTLPLKDMQVLMYDEKLGKWVNGTIDTGLDETALGDYLSRYKYATQDYVDGKIEPFADLLNWFEFDTENNAVKLKEDYNFIVPGAISFGGAGEASGEGSGGLSQVTVKLGDVAYTSDAGVVSLPAYPTALKNPYALSWSGYSSGSYDGSGTANIAIPTSLPASDVYDWAKTASKPSYAFSEITSKPTTIEGYGITNGISFFNNRTYVGASLGDLALSQLAANSYIELWDSPGWWNLKAGKYIVSDGTSSQFLKADGSLDSTAYLPLSGGVISAAGWGEQLTIKNTTASQDIILRFNSGNSYVGGIGYLADGTPVVNISGDGNYEIISAKNIGSQSVSYASSAGNASSATKLQTARTIWGQSFDGSGNVDGVLTVSTSAANGSLSIYNNYLDSWQRVFTALSANMTGGQNYSLFFGKANNSYNAGVVTYNHIADGSTSNRLWFGLYSADELMSILANGNVLIGTTTDMGVKLYVAGNFVATGAITFGSDERYKTKLSDVAISLEKIAKAPLFNYKWNDREDDKEHLGTTAQYWYDTDFKNAVCPTNNEKLWTMSYSEVAMGNTIVIARELLPIKRKVSEIDGLKDRLNKAENRIVELENELKEYRRIA